MAVIHFVDEEGNPTADYVLGMPTVWLDIQVGFDSSAYGPKDPIAPEFQRCRGLIDTGANHVVIDTSLAIGLEPLRPAVDAKSTTFHLKGDVFSALILIVGMPRPCMLEVVARPLKERDFPLPLIIGRDLLSAYKLIYDTPRRDFRLEP
jgi:hypothetical protein